MVANTNIYNFDYVVVDDDDDGSQQTIALFLRSRRFIASWRINFVMKLREVLKIYAVSIAAAATLTYLTFPYFISSSSLSPSSCNCWERTTWLYLGAERTYNEQRRTEQIETSSLVIAHVYRKSFSFYFLFGQRASAEVKLNSTRHCRRLHFLE